MKNLTTSTCEEVCLFINSIEHLINTNCTIIINLNTVHPNVISSNPHIIRG